MNALPTTNPTAFETRNPPTLPAFDLVRDTLTLVEQKMKQLAEEDFGPLSRAILSLLDSGGKRLRPAIAILASRFHPCDQERLINLAAAIEILHTATLVHDDVIDGAMLRRGMPTLNARWSPGATVLAGDYLFARAAQLAADTDDLRVVRIFAHTLGIVVAGELRQGYNNMNWKQPREEYYYRIYAKTASLFAAASEAGAVLSGAPEHEIAALRDYGRHLGMAFQVMDDILDFTGDEATLGKPAGSDLRHGTLTLPVFYYLQSHPNTDEAIEELRRIVQDGNGSIESALRRIHDAGAVDAAYHEARAFAAQAKAALQSLPAIPERQALADLADFTITRKH